MLLQMLLEATMKDTPTAVSQTSGTLKFRDTDPLRIASFSSTSHTR